MKATGVLPWQNPLWRQLTDRLAHGQLAHALLFHGPEGVGKQVFGEQLAKRLLCETAQGQAQACGHCRSCQLLQAESHEDLFQLTLDEDRSSIGIDAVRALIDFMNLTPRRGNRKVAMIFPAERMTVNAANSLLKILEEPTASAVFILISSRPAMLPATVRSRCQKVQLSLPDESAALDWLGRQLPATEAAYALRRARGAPMRALIEANAEWQQTQEAVFNQWRGIAGDASGVFDTAQVWSKKFGTQALRWVNGWVGDMARCIIADDDASVVDAQRRDALQAMAKRVDLKPLFNHWGTVERAVRDNDGALNSQLLIENVLLEWAALFDRAARGSFPRTGQ